MSSPHEPVTPTPFTPVQPQTASAAAAAAVPATQQRWIVPALLILLALALAVIFWLPGRLQAPAPAPDATPAASNSDSGVMPANQAAREPPAEAAASPWSDAQQARLRKEAQDVLAQLLPLQFELEERGAASWAPEALASATAAAGRGDGHYQAREFVPAKEQYEASLTQLQALQAAIPAILEAALQRAVESLETGDREALDAALAQAALLAPDSPELAALAARAASMDALQALLATAAAAETAGDLAAAEQQLREATDLDPDSRQARAQLARVSAAHGQQRFHRSMSEGYEALDRGSFAEARSAFQKAGTLQANSAEVSTALAELKTAETAARLAGLQRQGRNLEDSEAWEDAVARYQEALQLDATLVFAQEGLARVEPRARLDRQLREALEAPERLADPAVAASLEKVLQQARTLSPQGKVLAAQLSELEQTLAQATTPLTVTLRSDQQTEVLVQRVARLGQFSERELELRPGTYTAVGSRNGYRDVRQTFTLRYGEDPPPVFIACTEPI
ncbi:MAG: tetratricopeptide repeat protein [Haliea sp.]